MSNLSTQEIIIEDLVKEGDIQRAKVNSAWGSLLASQSAVVTTFSLGFAVARAVRFGTALFRISFDKQQSRKRHLQTLLTRLLQKIRS